MKETKKSLRIMVCKDIRQLHFYFREMLDRVVGSGREFTTNRRDRIAEKEDIYIFMTPDMPDKLAGLRIAGWDELGTCYEHPKYREFIDEIERRII